MLFMVCEIQQSPDGVSIERFRLSLLRPECSACFWHCSASGLQSNMLSVGDDRLNPKVCSTCVSACLKADEIVKGCSRMYVLEVGWLLIP